MIGKFETMGILHSMSIFIINQLFQSWKFREALALEAPNLAMAEFQRGNPSAWEFYEIEPPLIGGICFTYSSRILQIAERDWVTQSTKQYSR